MTQRPLQVTPLPTERGSEPISGSIDEPGSLAVFTLDVKDAPAVEGAESLIEIVVTSPAQGNTSGKPPAGKPGEKPDPRLDVEIDVIEPEGGGSNIDLKAVGDGERTTVGGAAGQYLIVVRDHGASTGSFEITATKVTYTTMSAHDGKEGVVKSDDAAVFAIDVPADSRISVTVTPTPNLDAVLNLVDPFGDARAQPVDSSAAGEAEVAVLTVKGRHILRVTGYGGASDRLRSSRDLRSPPRLGISSRASVRPIRYLRLSPPR